MTAELIRPSDEIELYRTAMMCLEVIEEAGGVPTADKAADVCRRVMPPSDADLIERIRTAAFELLTRKLH